MIMKMIKFLLLTLVVISPLPISIYGDKALMENVCHNAPVPTTCMKCLESDPTSLDADRLGLASIVLDCLDSHLHILTKNITELLAMKQKGDAKKHKGDAIKKALVDCKKGLKNATSTLSEAKTGLKNGDYNEAGTSLRVAVTFPVTCQDYLEQAKFSHFEYPQVYNQVNLYVQLSEAASRIIDRF